MRNEQMKVVLLILLLIVICGPQKQRVRECTNMLEVLDACLAECDDESCMDACEAEYMEKC